MQGQIANYSWTEELEKAVVNALSTSFGLDFLLFQDKVGGDVNTIHNVRQGVYATDEAKNAFANRPEYDSTAYHTHDNYKATGAHDKQQQQAGTLHDPYRNKTMGAAESRNLDHVISAYEVHNDPGRVLAGLSGVELANQSSNLQSTSETVNKSKKQKSVSSYLEGLPNLISQHQSSVAADEKRLAEMPRNSPQEKHEARVMEDRIASKKNKIKELESIDVKGMKKRDAEARAEYEKQIHDTYYQSKEFAKATTHAALNAGVNLGLRQALGLVFAEVWFELRTAIPRLVSEMKNDFSFTTFSKQIRDTLDAIWQRVTAKFADIVSAFRTGATAGFFSNIQNTITNIFKTTSKRSSKIIRELWVHVIGAIKLAIFNPEKLELVPLCQALVAMLSTGVAVVLGTLLHGYLLPLCTFPLGDEVAAFLSALATGIATVGLNYFLIYSPFAQKLWHRFAMSMPYAQDVQKFREINASLDKYLEDYSKLEFNMDADDLFMFAFDLKECNSELERNIVLRAQLEKQNVEVPFEMGNLASTKGFLKSLIK